MEIHPYPHIDDESKVPTDGTVFRTPDYCYEADRSKCEKHYREVQESGEGVYTCPYGFSTYVHGESHIVYTGLRIGGHYNKTKLKNRVDDSNEYIPSIPLNIIRRTAQRVSITEENLNYFEDKYFEIEEKIDEVRQSNSKFKQFINKNLHEIRGFNADIKSTTEDLLDRRPDTGSEGSLRSILAWSNLISARLNAYDIQSNPGIITKGSRAEKNIYKKFDKARMCYNPKTDNRDISIDFHGESYFCWPAYEIFDLLPFLLLDNAIKYSPAGQSIDVSFTENDGTLTVLLESYGPPVEEDEIDMLVKDGFRGSAAKEIEPSGEGIGLYIASFICKNNNVEMKLESGDEEFRLSNNPYSKFRITLIFDKHSL